MNIFYVNEDPEKAAQDLPNKLIVKMPLETAQLLSTAINELSGHQASKYKTTHKNHPSAIWARTSVLNFDWLFRHGIALCDEYTFRYGKTHKCKEVILDCQDKFLNLTLNLKKDLTEMPKCMPDKYKEIKNPVEAYRAYMIGEKQHYAKWTKREMPKWWKI